MCGIAGIVSRDFETLVDLSRVARMRDSLAHRGPDDAGLWMGGSIVLGHRRLSIIDVAGGHQPMSSPDGAVRLVYNGEIYNHGDLRARLTAAGRRYRTRCDTETILHLYDEYGERFVDHLRGMFALALWDARRRRLVLARDRLGIKPLYYAVTANEILFGSEIKALLAAGVRPALNTGVVPEFLATRFVSGEETMIQGVRRLLPGHIATWSPGEDLRVRRYWQLPEPDERPAGDFRREAEDLRHRLVAAVRRHLMSDVPLGVFLSGGIDSSALAAMAAGLVDEPLRTFSVGFAEREANELPYARLVAQRLGAQHQEVVVSPAQFFEALPHLVWHEDEPIAFTSSVPLFFVSRLAREHVKVVLTGEGADELFLGYNRYRVTLWNWRLGRAYQALAPAPLRSAVRRSIGHLPRHLARYATRSFLAYEPDPRALFFENFAVFSTSRQRELLAGDFDRTHDPFERALDVYNATAGAPLDRMSRTDLQTYLHELLMKQDQMSMAASIESRVPFLDDDVVEHVAGLPASLKLRGWTTKAVLRAAVEDLVPVEILRRSKMGFPVPLGSWLRHEFADVIDEFVLGGRTRDRRLFDPAALARLAAEHRGGRANHGDRLWLLINLEIWQRIVCDGEDRAHVMDPVEQRRRRRRPHGPLKPHGKLLQMMAI